MPPPLPRDIIKQYQAMPSDALIEAYEEAERSGKPEHRRNIEDLARPAFEELARLQAPPSRPQSPPGRKTRNMPPIHGPQDIAPALLQKFESAAARPYEPFGAGAIRAAAEIAKKYKRYKLKPGENILSRLTPEQMKLVMSNDRYAKNLLSIYGTPRKNIDTALALLKSDIVMQHPKVIGMPPLKAPDIKNMLNESVNLNQELSGLRKQEQTLLSQASRLAPLQPSHQKVKELIENYQPNESLRLAEKEIAAAGHTNIPRSIEHYLKQASNSPQAFVNQYKIDYGPLIDTFRQEARKDFMEHVKKHAKKHSLL